MKKLYLWCIAALLIVNGPAAAQKRQHFADPIIDVHMHCYSKTEWEEENHPNPVTGNPLTARNDQDHFRETVAAMKKYNIVRGMVSNNYDAALKWHDADPGRFIVGYSFEDPAKVDLKFLRQEILAGRVKVIGEVAPQYEGIAPNDSRLEPIFALAEELDVPVAYHIHPGPWGAVYKGMPKMRQSINSPLLLEDVIIKHPKLRIYVMHAGYPRLDEMINMLYAYPQIYVDIGVIDWTRPRKEFHYYLRRIVEAGFGERIMFGSDQMVWTDAIPMAIENVRSAKFLTKKQKGDIFYNNAVRFFRLDAAGNERVARPTQSRQLR